ncbi:hypothetical protein [Umezawaea tangerina]|uniref:Peptidase inhibitor family I36 n=1 Tax=Umezawaea tangerina TaxID=84725 RepID=A0A2T0TFY8_9PSEU|nr:hypothetical protein [Umezawaea tangerina]PRY44565.1 hypothetical protein CLV43_102130 [Umezawaea tangerina]
MTIRRAVAALAVCAAALLGWSAPATARGADTAPPTCSSEPKSVTPVEIGYNGLWTYTYTLSWCVEAGSIVWVLPDVSHVEHSTACAWAGRMEESVTRGTESWVAFDMSEYTCVRGDGGVQGVNPWVVVTVHPNGTYEVSHGVED